MFTLKGYQKEALEKLALYLKRVATTRDIKGSYALCTKENFNHEGVYNDAGFSKVPYVCLRLPTGGGKTLLASHTISIVCKEYLGRDFTLVLWLVPSNAILEQTLKALRDRNHPYRKVIDLSFEGNVSVLTVEDALYMTPSSLKGNLNVIVSTIAAWRQKSTEGRKVYQDNGSLKDHFDNLPENLKINLEHFESEDGNILKHSLANVVYINHPLLIIDEAHNARTPLTFETIERLNPSCIIEYTATPQTKGIERSNVLYSVSAAVLKAENIIKMPIELLTAADWQTTISNAVKKQNELEEIAKEEHRETGKYIRPIVLLQAQPESQQQSTVGVDEVKKCLMTICNVPVEQIAVATGDVRGIEGIDLMRDDCKIRYIITKQALKEGWDCPYAYVFCSVAVVRSSKDVEQLLGRVLRMPYVEPKKRDPLNRAYAFISSQDFYETANNLTDSLTHCGFDPNDAAQLLEIKNTQADLFGDYFGQITRTLSELPASGQIPETIADKVVINQTDNTITLKERITESEKEQLQNIVQSADDKEVIEQMYRAINHVSLDYTSPQKRGEIISVPQLLFKFDDEARVFDEEVLILPAWSLADCDPILNESEFPLKVDSGTLGLIDIDYRGTPVIHTPTQIQQELTSIVVSSAMTKAGLISWIVRETKHPAIPHAQSVVFVNKVIDGLIEKRGLNVEHLVFMRFRLRDAIREKIQKHCENAKKTGYQTLLFKNKEKGAFAIGQDFQFPPQYPVNTLYSGNLRFKNHFYDQIGDMNNEEAQCALIIDSHSNVQTWVRNLERQEMHSFWLQTSTDKFYPDFVVKLEIGKILVVEYKGKDRYGNPDSEEKRLLGEFWESVSRGKCLFVMLNGMDWDTLRKKLEA